MTKANMDVFDKTSLSLTGDEESHDSGTTRAHLDGGKIKVIFQKHFSSRDLFFLEKAQYFLFITWYNVHLILSLIANHGPYVCKPYFLFGPPNRKKLPHHAKTRA